MRSPVSAALPSVILTLLLKTSFCDRNSIRTQLATERAPEIIGEAAGKVSKSFREKHPEIPWRQIIGQRNVLIHEYGQIRHDRVWRVVKEGIPQLIETLTPMVD